MLFSGAHVLVRLESSLLFSGALALVRLESSLRGSMHRIFFSILCMSHLLELKSSFRGSMQRVIFSSGASSLAPEGDPKLSLTLHRSVRFGFRGRSQLDLNLHCFDPFKSGWCNLHWALDVICIELHLPKLSWHFHLTITASVESMYLESWPSVPNLPRLAPSTNSHTKHKLATGQSTQLLG